MASLEDYDLVELLAEALRRDESWFNAMTDILREDLIPNSHRAYTRLLEGAIAVGEFGGFPWSVFRAAVLSKIDEVHALVTQ